MERGMFKTTRALKFGAKDGKEPYSIPSGYRFNPEQEIPEGAYTKYQGGKVFIPKSYYDLAETDPLTLKGLGPERGERLR